VAIRHAGRVRSAGLALVAAIAALCAAVLVVPTTALATPEAPAQPQTAADVQRQLGELALKNTQLVELFDQAQVDVSKRQARAEKAARDAAAAHQRFERVREVLGRAAAARYEGGSFSTTGALLTSASGEDYLSQIETLSMISTQTAQLVSRLTDAQRKADATQKRAKALLAEATSTRDKLDKDRRKVQQQIDKYRDLLGTLTAAEQAAYRQQTTPTVSTATIAQARMAFDGPAPHVTSAAAAQAVRFALAQVGKPYVFGAGGPDAYDCSGLTAAAWASAGVSLPHSAAMQFNYGRHVSFDELRPGDLMFFYQPIGHVTIYIGDGLMVSAPQSGENVSVVPANQFGSNFTGATRLTD
jgi:cell wall-associated NlpC family hydrolase